MCGSTMYAVIDPLYDAIPVPYASVRVTRSALVAHWSHIGTLKRLLSAEPRSSA